MQDNRTPRPSAVQLRSAAAKLAYYGDNVVAAWLTAQAVEQDELELRRSIAARTGLPEDDEYVVAAARKVAAEMTNTPPLPKE